MRALRHHTTGLARALAAIALLAMMVRALVPAGYMLAPAQNGRFITVTLCSAHGAAEAVIDLATGAVVDSNGDDKDRAPASRPEAPCVFATAAPLAAPVAAPPIPIVFRQGAALPTRFETSAPHVGLASPPPQSTGPPVAA